MTQSADIAAHANTVLIGNYARQPVVMTRGQGSLLWDADGKRYVDLFAGFGGCILGHCNPDLVEAGSQQMRKLWHVGNTFHTEPQIGLAEKLNETAFPGQAFFCHSGLESNEAACKLARLRGGTFSPKRWKIITLNKSFHGRSLAMIAATGNPAVKAGFEPAVGGFIQVEPGNFDALAAAVDDETCAIMLEPIQGEGGINVYPADYFSKIRKLCDQRQLTLICDEVWTGCGRTGRWFGFQHFQHPDGSTVIPDIITIGKAIGGGLPVGVMYARPEVAALLIPGKHGCTLGGNPVCMAVAKTIFDVIARDHLLEHAARLGEDAKKKIKADARLSDKVVDVRGKGLMLGVELRAPIEKLVEKGLNNGVILNVTAQKVVRLAPAINITADQFSAGLTAVLDTIAASPMTAPA